MTTDWVSPVTGRTVRLHWNSRFARLGGGINNCITLSAGHIFISRDWVTADGLAHEDGHAMQAVARGWQYLPWVLWGYLRYGYAQSPAEVDADAAMFANSKHYRTLWARDFV